jgi:hypothetical protein
MSYFFNHFSLHFMTSSSLALYYGAKKRWQAMGARTYVLLDIADGKSEQAGQGPADVISVKIAHAYA